MNDNFINQEKIWPLIYVGFGGSSGAILRMGLLGFASTPFNILIINVVGSFMLGVLMYSTEFGNVNPHFRLFFGIGFLGSLTTFSNFALQTYTLASASLVYSIANIFLSLILGIAAIIAGREAVIYVSSRRSR